MKHDIKILFVWTGVTSYMADCWRRLQAAEGVELKVVVENVYSGSAFDAERVLGGLDAILVESGTCGAAHIGLLDGWKPDVVFAVGWHSPVVREIVERDDWRSIPKVCCFDMPWRWLPRCIAARWAQKPILRRYRYPEKQHHYVLMYYLNGMMAVITEWLEADCNESPEELAKIIMRCVIPNETDQ